MDIQEIQKRKAAAETQIADILREFTAATTMTVDAVRITPVAALGAPTSYVVELEAKL
jgi:hypothetical protein